jgi:hypothetical protein
MADDIKPDLLKTLWEFPDICTSNITVDIPSFPVSVGLTNVGYETRNKTSGSFTNRLGVTLILHWDYITNGNLAQLISFWDRHEGKLLPFVLPKGHCIRTTIGIQTSLIEVHKYWRFDNDNITFDIDADKNIVNLDVRIKNITNYNDYCEK